MHRDDIRDVTITSMTSLMPSANLTFFLVPIGSPRISNPFRFPFTPEGPTSSPSPYTHLPSDEMHRLVNLNGKFLSSHLLPNLLCVFPTFTVVDIESNANNESNTFTVVVAQPEL